MIINEGNVSLTRSESRVFGCRPEVAIGDLACAQVIDTLLERRKSFDTIAPDMYTVFGIIAQRKQLDRALETAANVAGSVLVYEIEAEYDIPHAPYQRPEEL